MRLRILASTVLVFIWTAALFCSGIGAQAPKPAATPAPAPAKTPARSATTAAPKVYGNLAQLMKGIMFPNSNVIFFGQTKNPGDVKPADDPSASTDPLSDTYGGWTAVENSSIAIAEATNLLMLPGRVCSNGKPVPIQNADWIKFVQGLREAAMASYKAAQSKSQDAIVDVSDTLTTACGNCHNVYREKTAAQGGLAGRCTK